jgi:cyclophilin family peptidyl-prolyl cis-trans isomerase
VNLLLRQLLSLVLCRSLLLVLFFPLLLLIGCRPANPGTASDGDSLSRARTEFEDTFDRWQIMLGELRDLELAFHTVRINKREALAERYYGKLSEGYTLENELLTSATRAFVAAPEENEDLKEFLIQIAVLLVNAECYEDGLRVSQFLIDNQVEELGIYESASTSAFACAEFDLAERYLRIIVEHEGELGRAERSLQQLETCKVQWRKEQKLREAEQLAANLPRVILRTQRGEIELELFENEAPNTVANFIQLVERGFYDGLPFHKVLREFAAISGCPNGDGTGSPGYYIPHEFNKSSHRVHFRGSLSTVSEGPFANGCQFHLTFLPAPQLEGQSTVFGRIVRGMEVLAKLQRRGDNVFSSKIRPDRIVTARVLRKRNHVYEPKTIPDPAAKQRQEGAEMMKRLLSR